MTDIKPQDVVTTGGTQSRAQISEDTVASYAEAIENGALLPPIVVYHDGSAYWLADGFHRLMAYTRLGVEWIPADVKQGTRRDAVLYSVGANSDHGLPRTNADKRHAIGLLLADDEWRTWSSREIARHCHVGHQLVEHVKNILGDSSSTKSERRFTHHKTGKPTTMRTENIGKRDTGVLTKAGRRLVLPQGKALGDERAAQIKDLVGQGFRAAQIANELGIGEPQVRLLAKKFCLELPDAVFFKSPRINARRVIEQTVISMEACAQSINAVPVDFSTISKEDATEWTEAVAESLTIFRRFHNKLKEAANV